MRFKYFVLLVAPLILSSGSADTTTILSVRDQVVDTFSHRSLRIHTKPTEDRAWWSRAPKLLLSIDDMKQLAKEGNSVDDIFKKLDLDKIATKDDKLDDVIDKLKRTMGNNPNIKQFIRYLDEVKAEPPVQTIVSSLDKKYGDEAVAKMLFNARESYRGENKVLAEKMLEAQYVKWYTEKKSTNAVIDLLGIEHKTWYENPFVKIWWEFVQLRAKYISKGILPVQPVEI
ncbi:RxLR effector protein [Phytophthora megakarya]|uniref:RxLR effector protein n=1 Tax=Phytophthora megakarya TaxID=4795 RepID=A0A225VRR3_9STRA|nr:RxLR effector protein [Phytophthora megakarya]